MYEDYAEYVEAVENEKNARYFDGNTQDLLYKELPKYLDYILKSSGKMQEYAIWDDKYYDYKRKVSKDGEPPYLTLYVIYEDRISGVKIKVSVTSVHYTNGVYDRFRLDKVEKVSK